MNDLRPGPPLVRVFFDQVTEVDPDTQEPVTIEREVLANGSTLLTDVYRDTEILMVFDDLMNPATVVNPVTNEAVFIEVSIDPDGNPQDPSDQVPLPGSFSISLDQLNAETIVRFTPSEGLPSSGLNPSEPRLLVVSIPSSVVDLGGNGLANAGSVLGVPEQLFFPEAILPGGTGEDFTGTDNLDADRSGAEWGPIAPASRHGRWLRPPGGLRRGSLDVVTLSTDSEEFAPGGLIDNYDPLTGMPEAGSESIVVDDGVFEFTRLTIEPGGSLRFEGANAPRVFVRGVAQVEGVLDVSGADAAETAAAPCDFDAKEESEDFCSGPPCDPLQMDPDAEDFCEDGVYEEYLALFDGGVGAGGRAGGGDGGDGADHPDTTEPTLLAIGGFDNPNALVTLDGQPGVGVPIPNVLAPTGTAAGGGAGLMFPGAFPANNLDVNSIFLDTACTNTQPGAPGGGGGYGTPGSDAAPRPYSGGGATPLAPIAAGGDPAGLGLTAIARTLNPELGFLRGGAGGGGGGAHVTLTKATAGGIPFCSLSLVPTSFVDYVTGQGAGGGGGGGAVQLQAGSFLSVNGVVDASGGDGGSSVTPLNTRLGNATGGGGGAGGGILLQGPVVSVAPLPGRIDVGRGSGGVSTGQASRAGSGGAGLVRVESGLTAESLIDFDNFSSRVEPTPAGLEDYAQPATTQDVLSIDNFSEQQVGPGARSGAQSCWLRPEGNIFFVDYLEDDLGSGQLGWDMTIAVQGAEFSWRTPQAGFGGVSLEELVGSDLGESPIVVRFQGMRAIRPIEDFCDVQLTGLERPDLPRLADSMGKAPGRAQRLLRQQLDAPEPDPLPDHFRSLERALFACRRDNLPADPRPARVRSSLDRRDA